MSRRLQLLLQLGVGSISRSRELRGRTAATFTAAVEGGAPSRGRPAARRRRGRLREAGRRRRPADSGSRGGHAGRKAYSTLHAVAGEADAARHRVAHLRSRAGAPAVGDRGGEEVRRSPQRRRSLHPRSASGRRPLSLCRILAGAREPGAPGRASGRQRARRRFSAPSAHRISKDARSWRASSPSSSISQDRWSSTR